MQRFFIVSEGKYPLRDGCKFVLPKVKRRCISFKGVQLWNSTDLKLKHCASFVVLKKSFPCTIGTYQTYVLNVT